MRHVMERLCEVLFIQSALRQTLNEALAALVDQLLAVLHFRLERLQLVVTLAVLSCNNNTIDSDATERG